MATFAEGLRLGRYDVVRKLGQGGFGVIYVARDVELDREVALKFLRPEHVARKDLVQRFLLEARSAAKIHHAGIVTVFECGQVDSHVYIAMELLHGEGLNVRLKRDGRLAPDLAINITRQVCSALTAAHAAGIVHRDLKPDNLFLVADPAVRGGVRVKILDFGVAKLADGQFADGVRTHSAMLLGTPMYMSPEQCKSSAKVDHRSDIYAVGCILYQLLTGRPPYTGDAGELIAQHQLAPVPTTRTLAPELPPTLEQIVTQMLAKQPDARPTMAAIDSALASIDATDALPRARPPSLPPPPAPTSVTTMFHSDETRPDRPISRPLLVGGALAVIALGVILGVVVTRDDDPPPAPAPAPAPVAIVIDAAPPPPPVAIDAAPLPDPRAEIELRCTRLRADRKWPQLVDCADTDLAPHDADLARELHDTGIAENKAETAVRKLDAAVRARDHTEAKRLVASIPDTSVYHREANELFALLPTPVARRPAQRPTPEPAPDEPDEPRCDADALKRKGEDYLGNGMDTAALAQFEASLRCKYNSEVIKKAFLAACRSKQESKARQYYAKLPQRDSQHAAICERFGIKL